ncbi:methyltransferase [Arenicella chitinivorans]|uniref:Methyltransferase n=1 Tax=Arenicella chitinivorans TaxID=1329800 RepID=A0A918RLU6_9GAMM|nr:methylated-DNA--[protein]-cysteine S-methyltransferase [Arenicella chitinivorans]GHA01383.1 methyltransferase [Arenicella chitinivorans]
MSGYYAQVYEVVRAVPSGRVVTYGQVAQLIGRPRHARQIGYALSALPAGHDVPWHRVVNAKGEVSRRAVVDYEAYQRMLLEDEGIEFDCAGRIELQRYQWLPPVDCL